MKRRFVEWTSEWLPFAKPVQRAFSELKSAVGVEDQETTGQTVLMIFGGIIDALLVISLALSIIKKHGELLKIWSIVELVITVWAFLVSMFYDDDVWIFPFASLGINLYMILVVYSYSQEVTGGKNRTMYYVVY